MGDRWSTIGVTTEAPSCLQVAAMDAVCRGCQVVAGMCPAYRRVTPREDEGANGSRAGLGSAAVSLVAA